METGITPCHGVDDHMGGLAADIAGWIFRFGLHVPEDGTSGPGSQCEIRRKADPAMGVKCLISGFVAITLAAMPTPDHDPCAVRRNPRAGRLARLLMIVAWVALLLQLGLSLQAALADGRPVTEGLMVYFGYFTIWTNLFVALALTLPADGRFGRLHRFFNHPQILACAATSMILVGLAYHFLLRQIWNPEGLQWIADLLLHYVMPAGFCVHWFRSSPKSPLPWWSPLVWSLYPFLYFCHALVRGLLLDAYPYPFIDVTEIGYLPASLNALTLMAAFGLVGIIMLAAGKALERAKAR